MKRQYQIANNITLCVLVIITASCSSVDKLLKKKKDPKVYGGKEFVDSLVSDIKPKWHRGIKRFRLESQEGKPVPHLFFDVDPALNQKSLEANVVVLTPSDSNYLYQLDIKSGQKFTSRKFCSVYDSWKRYQKTVSFPKFSLGVLPRYLDQLNTPQKVLIFGQNKYFETYHETHYFDVRIIGGFIERECPRGTCLDKDEWRSRLVLVAMKDTSEADKQIKNIDDLSLKYDWEYARAFIENAQGKNKISTKYYPAFEMGAIISAEKAIEYTLKNSTFFSLEKMKSLKKSCYGLYDLLWKDLSFKSIKESFGNSLKETRKKEIMLEKLKEKGKAPIEVFWRRFAKLFRKYNQDFKTCSKYVYHSNINDSYKRHWFLSHLEAFFKVHELGFSYRCQAKVWAENLRMPDGKLLYPLKDELQNCSPRALKIAMETIPKILEGNYLRSRESYRYITYDKQSHKKIYGLVPLDNKRNRCGEKKVEFFPRDVKWKR